MAVGVEVGHDVVERVPSGLHIGGAWREAPGGRTLPVEDPGNGELLAEIADGTAEDALVAYLFTQDIDRALRVGERLETGMLGLNQGIVSNPAAPFGGVKASGFGRQGGREGIEEHLSTKYFATATG
jgi:succinate-semialdehyde dehydrogenase/glutarate-semialdehyde dehydrogenase